MISTLNYAAGNGNVQAVSRFEKNIFLVCKKQHFIISYIPILFESLTPRRNFKTCFIFLIPSV